MSVVERDPHSGQLTTGHEWNGITELDTPVPKATILFLCATTIFAIVWWILMPAWPVGTTYTKGILDIDERAELARDLARAEKAREAWSKQILQSDFAATQANPGLKRLVEDQGDRLFADNCSVCHGPNAAGVAGYPNLSDPAWLWGGDENAILETLRVGVNSSHEDTRTSQMLAFGREGILDRDAIQNVVSYVETLSAGAKSSERTIDQITTGKKVFAENCASCHGEGGQGNLEVGAPNLTDQVWVYGGDRQSIYTSVFAGRQGHMPHWDQRLSEVDRKLLAFYVVGLGKSR